MATSRGYAARFGFKREALVYTPTWPAASPATITALLPAQSEAIQEQIGYAEHEEVEGMGAYRAPSLVSRQYGGPLVIDMLDYQGLEEIFGCVMGFQAYRISGNTMPEQVEVGAHRHLFECDVDLGDRAWRTGEGQVTGDLTTGQQFVRRGTLAIDKQVSVWEFRSLMFNGFTFEATPGNVSLTLDTVAYDIDLAPATNTAAALAALTRPVVEPVLYNDMVMRLAPFSASVALGAGDNINPTAFQLSLANNLQTDLHTTLNGVFVDIPRRNGVLDVGGAFVFPRYDNNTLLTNMRADDEMMCSIEFTGSIIGATSTNYRLTFWLPSVRLTQVDVPIGSAGLPQVAHTMQAYRPAIAAAGFPTNLKSMPLMVELVSAVSTHVFL